MKACGIDLGTTNSCIIVVDGDGGRVIADEYDHKLFPSVVYGSRDGKISVGYAAKNRMGEFPGPVATVKRKMGSTEKVVLGGRERTPVEVSAMILTHLKQLAERQVGEGIDRAVVTVPAYFSHIQRQQTDEAGRLAGFSEVVTLLEPVAAALAYSLSSEADKLRVFVYDLGGGTFDATVLEKDSYGGITVLSFGGDPYLGGDDVDARLARHMIQKLSAKGYNLDLNLDDAEDFSRFQRFKFYAELAKKDLSLKEETALTHQGFMQDKEGETIDLDMVVTRAELEELARDLVQRSVDASLQTIAKKEIPLDSIDEVIMVGGMSRMPLVQRMLAEAFGREPQVVDPDLIVARGAAIKAAEVFGEQEVAASGLKLELRYDKRTDRPQTSISGLFDRPLDGHTVYLINDANELAQRVEGGDRFTFEDVPLVPLSENVFTLSVEDAEDNPIIEREVRITQEEGAAQVLVSPGSVITKPIQIWTADGLEVLFPENTALPQSVTHPFETGDQSGQIIAPIWEGDHEVNRLEIKDIPPQLKVGTPVIIEVRVESDYHISARASVPDIKREVSIKFRIEPVDTSGITPDFVRGRLAELEREAQEAVEKCPSEEAADLFQFHFRQVKSQIEVELSEMEPKRAKLKEKLGELSALIQKLPSRDGLAELKPTYEEFSERLRAIVGEASERNHSKLPQALPQIEALEAQARKAWEGKDPIVWRRINEQLLAVERLLQPEIEPSERALGMAAWLVAKQVVELREAAAGRHAQEIDSIEGRGMEIFLRTQMGLMEPPIAINELIDLYQKSVVPLRKSLGLHSAEQPTVVSPAAMDGVIRKRKP